MCRKQVGKYIPNLTVVPSKGGKRVSVRVGTGWGEAFISYFGVM